MTQTYQIAPPLTGDDFERLKASIIERGVEVAVIVDEDGNILDGHNRSMIADSLGIEYPRDVRTGLAEHEKRLLAVELNLARRHLTNAQKVLVGQKIEPDIAERARLRQAEAGKNYGRGVDSSATVVAELSEPKRAVDEVAQAVGIGSGRTYERDKKVIELARKHAPELLAHVENGDWTVAKLKRELVEIGVEVPTSSKKKAVSVSGGPAKETNPTPKPQAVANVPPHVRKVTSLAHDVTQRIRLLRSQHDIGRLVLGSEGVILAGELETLRDELNGFAQELRAAIERQATSGGHHGNAAS